MELVALFIDDPGDTLGAADLFPYYYFVSNTIVVNYIA